MAVKRKRVITSPRACPMLKFGFTPVCGFKCGFHTNVSLSKICSNDTGICDPSKCNSRLLGPSTNGRLTLKISKHTRCIVPCFAMKVKLNAGIVRTNKSLGSFCRVLTLGVRIAHGSFLRVKCGLRSFRSPGCLVLKFKFEFGGGCPAFREQWVLHLVYASAFCGVCWGCQGVCHGRTAYL